MYLLSSQLNCANFEHGTNQNYSLTERYVFSLPQFINTDINFNSNFVNQVKFMGTNEISTVVTIGLNSVDM